MFRLDAIARELKELDKKLKSFKETAGVTAEFKPFLDSAKWCWGHCKDIINQCLTETHKLHIGAPTDDTNANRKHIVGCGRRAYLIVDAKDHPDAIKLTHLR